MGATSQFAASNKGGAGAKRFLARFRRDRGGSVAIEFAALVIPFALLVFAILESCISFAGQEVMANAADKVARQLRTGQIRAANLDKTKLKKMICDQLDIIVAQNCPGLEVDLRNYTNFADAAKLRFTITDGNIVLTKSGVKDPNQFIVSLGGTGTKNILRVFYKWPVMTDFMAKSMANLNGNATLHYTSVTFQNEDFD